MDMLKWWKALENLLFIRNSVDRLSQSVLSQQSSIEDHNERLIRVELEQKHLDEMVKTLRAELSTMRAELSTTRTDLAHARGALLVLSRTEASLLPHVPPKTIKGDGEATDIAE